MRAHCSLSFFWVKFDATRPADSPLAHVVELWAGAVVQAPVPHLRHSPSGGGNTNHTLRRAVSLSLVRTTCVRDPAAVSSRPADAFAGLPSPAYMVGDATGRETTNSLPAPGPALLATTFPPCRSTMRLTTFNPIPRPLRECPLAVSTRM